MPLGQACSTASARAVESTPTRPPPSVLPWPDRTVWSARTDPPAGSKAAHNGVGGRPLPPCPRRTPADDARRIDRPSRDELQTDLATAPAAKRDTAWFHDRAKALESIDRQIARLGIAPADGAELAAHADARQGDRPESESQPTAGSEAIHDDDDELWWGEHGPTRLDHFDAIA